MSMQNVKKKKNKCSNVIKQGKKMINFDDVTQFKLITSF